MNSNIKPECDIAIWRTGLSQSEQVSTIIELLKALNLGALVPSAFTLALMWKLYGFFNQLSEKLTKIETKIDGLKEILPYKIKEAIEEEKTAQTKEKTKKHNPAIEKSDIVEVIGVSFGISDLLIFLSIVYSVPTLLNTLYFWILFMIPGLFGLSPLLISKKIMPKNIRAVLSLISVLPWIYLILVIYGVLPSL